MTTRTRIETYTYGVVFPLLWGALGWGGLAGCGGVDALRSETFRSYSVNYYLAAVEGGSCVATNGRGDQFMGTTVGGVTTLEGGLCDNDSGLVKVTCTGGSYTDEATGAAKTAVTLRTYISCGSASRTVSATPLTELAVRAAGDAPTEASFASIAEKTASRFGLKGVDLNAVTPAGSGGSALASSSEGKYGAVLAVFSQMEKDATIGGTTAAVLDSLADAVDSKGEIKKSASASVQNAFKTSLQSVSQNPLLATAVPEALAKEIFDVAAAEDDPPPSIDYINTDFSPTRYAFSQVLVSGVSSKINIVGENLHLDLQVTLDGHECEVRDLEALPGGESAEEDTDQEEMYADCPAVYGSLSTLVIREGEETVGEFSMPVQNPLARVRMAASQFLAPLTGSEVVSGTITAQAPSINTSTAAHSYSLADLRTFPVRGVDVQLLNAGAGNAVLAETVTDASGNYSFTSVPVGTTVMVRVLATFQSPVGGSGAYYNFAVRDNTSKTTPKALYTLDSATALVAAGTNTVNVLAGVGFNSDGTVSTGGSGRQSAPFAILEVVYNMVTNIVAAEPTIELLPLNIYWSVDNTPVSFGPGKIDLEKGYLPTSCFVSAGAMNGVFLLGKADVDTDEFDQAVIGHEIGHWLENTLSYSSAPGGSHTHRDFKDASGAYSEGIGTALGGLLASPCNGRTLGCQFYIDSSGAKQSSGLISNLDETLTGNIRGFYTESSVWVVAYKIAQRHGFAPFWRAFRAMRNSHEAATIFSFLAQYVALNPMLSIDDILAADNIRTKNALGTGAATADPAINSTASGGATDLETLYYSVPLVARDLAKTPANVPIPDQLNTTDYSFCFNTKLPGANLANGIGMRKHFTFTTAFTGTLELKFFDDKNVLLPVNNYSLSARYSTGVGASSAAAAAPVTVHKYPDGKTIWRIPAAAGRTYSVTIATQNPADVFNGNRCGNYFEVWRVE